MPTTLTPATRRHLALLVADAAANDGLITARQAAFIARHRATIAAEDPALARHLAGLRVCQ